MFNILHEESPLLYEFCFFRMVSNLEENRNNNECKNKLFVRPERKIKPDTFSFTKFNSYYKAYRK